MFESHTWPLRVMRGEPAASSPLRLFVCSCWLKLAEGNPDLDLLTRELLTRPERLLLHQADTADAEEAGAQRQSANSQSSVREAGSFLRLWMLTEHMSTWQSNPTSVLPLWVLNKKVKENLFARI